MRYPRLALYGAAVALVWSTSALALDAEVTGIDGEPAANIRHYLASVNAADYSRERLTRDIQQRAAKALKAYGYYSPSFQVTLEGKPEVERARIEVSSGERVIIQRLEVSIEGEARDDKAFTQALEAFPLHEGDPLRHAPYEGLRSRLSTLALQRGYFDARFTRHRIEVRPWQNSARIYLTFDSGPRYRFGDIRFSGSQIEQRRLINLLPFAAGDPYQADQLAEYNQRLGQTGWFRSIGVRPQIERTQPVAMAHRGWWEAVDLSLIHI